MMMFKKKTLIYKDKAGNRLFEDVDQRLILQNNLGKLVRPKEIKPFLKRPGVKQAVSKFYNKEIKFRVLSPNETKSLKPKVKGGLYK